MKGIDPLKIKELGDENGHNNRHNNRRSRFNNQFSIGNVITIIWITLICAGVYYGLKSDTELLKQEMSFYKQQFVELRVDFVGFKKDILSWEKQKDIDIERLKVEQERHWVKNK